MQDIINEFDGSRKEGQSVHLRHTGNSRVRLDKKILRNILLNLLSNAIKYSAKDVDIKSTSGNGKVKVQIADRGIGIPGNQQQSLFGKFFRAANVGDIQGTGLGLNIVKLYVEIMQGSINFRSKQDTGTTFTLTLPQQL